jgi:hypothetical protein
MNLSLLKDREGFPSHVIETPAQEPVDYLAQFEFVDRQRKSQGRWGAGGILLPLYFRGESTHRLFQPSDLSDPFWMTPSRIQEESSLVDSHNLTYSLRWLHSAILDYRYLPGPFRMKNSFLVNSAVGMGAEIIPLSLDQIGWKARASVRIEISQRRTHAWSGNA